MVPGTKGEKVVLFGLSIGTKGEKLNFYSSNFNNSSLVLTYSPLMVRGSRSPRNRRTKIKKLSFLVFDSVQVNIWEPLENLRWILYWRHVCVLLKKKAKHVIIIIDRTEHISPNRHIKCLIFRLLNNTTKTQNISVLISDKHID